MENLCHFRESYQQEIKGQSLFSKLVSTKNIQLLGFTIRAKPYTPFDPPPHFLKGVFKSKTFFFLECWYLDMLIGNNSSTVS